MRYEVRGTRSFSSLAAYRAPHAAYRLTGTKKKGKIVGSYLSFINLNLIVECGRTAK